MQRSSTISAAALAGLSLVLVACTGESPTSPKPVPTPGGSGGGCTVSVSLPPGPIVTVQGTAVSLRAVVTQNGVAVPDNSNVTFTTDFGIFAETLLPTVVKSTRDGVAEVSPGSLVAGSANVRASFGCGSATVQIQFTAAPDTGPYISLIQPNTGSAAGGDVVVINGGRFGSDPTAISSVTFGGAPTPADSVTNTAIRVHTPPFTLANPAVPQTVDVCIRFFGGAGSVCKAKSFTYMAIDPNKKVFISSVVPTSGSSAGDESVTIQGGNFGTSPATTRVTFCNFPATVTGVVDTQIAVLTPRVAPGICDVAATIDLGKVSEQSAVLPLAFTFTQAALTPTIYSISPRTGPNDSATRVTIFGTGFQFPEQVFMTGGACGTQKIEVPVVSSVNLNQIVFQTPVAAGGYACLAGQQVDVQVLNPTTGKTASCPGCFKYYSCPSVISATPPSIPTTSTTPTAVVVSGNNFEEPVTATFEAAGIPSYPLTVTSVSSTSVVVQMPPLSTIAPGLQSCQSVTGSIKITSTALAGCSPVLATLTYRATTATLTSATPNSMPQDGGSTVVTVKGSGFAGPMTVTLTKNGVPLSGTTASASVTDSGTLTFIAPAVSDGSMDFVNCSPVPNGPVNGTKAVPTQFGIRVTNLTSGCSSDLPGVLTYNPRSAIAVCTSALQITTSVMSAATVCSAYSFPIVASGGTPPYILYSASGLPSGLTINPGTGAVSGTPVLSSPGPGGTTSVNPTINVQDTASTVATKNVLLLFNDPTGPFTVSGTPSQTVPSTGSGPASAFSVVGGTGTINWSIDSGAPAGLTIATPGSPTNFVAAAVASGTYTVKVRATDSLCAPAHTNTVTVTVNVP